MLIDRDKRTYTLTYSIPTSCRQCRWSHYSSPYECFCMLMPEAWLGLDPVVPAHPEEECYAECPVMQRWHDLP